MPRRIDRSIRLSTILFSASLALVACDAQHANDGSQYYEEAMAMLNVSMPKRRENAEKAYSLLFDAANLNNTKALEMIAFGHLFGDTIRYDPQVARDIFQTLSQNGSAKAQAGLGFMHSVGLGVNSSQATALFYYTFAAFGQDCWAHMALGYRFLYGVNVQQSCQTALTHYRNVADNVVNMMSHGIGTAVHRIRLTDDIEDPGAPGGGSAMMEDNLLQYYKFLADKGDLTAQVGLGQLFMTGGRGVEQNFDQATNYLFLASHAGSSTALGLLGKMYLDGTSATPADNATAFQFFKRSADKNNPIGQSGLGYVYLKGLGVEVDYEKAYKLLNAAAEQGNTESQYYLGTMFYKGLGISKDYAVALKYFQLASQAGNVLAMYSLAQMHNFGLGVMQSCHTAVEFYKNVAERGKWSSMLMQAYSAHQAGRLNEALTIYLFLADLGYEIGQSNAAYLIDKGDVSVVGSRQEQYQRALLLWNRAASQGSGYARLKVADYHYYGKGTAVDYEEAMNNYKLASELQRVPQAMFNLGYMLEQGIGIQRDLHLAKRFYDMALEVSPDAALPVNLALIKLSFLFVADFFHQNAWWKLDFLDRAFGSYWDFYVIPFVCFAIAALVTLRRQR